MKQYNGSSRCIQSALVPYKWQKHSATDCPTCDMFNWHSKGGRPKHLQKNRGCPGKHSNKATIDQLYQSAPPTWKASEPLTLSLFLPTFANVSLTDLQCTVCMHIVDRPVETNCGKLACCNCMIHYLQNNETQPASCPCCGSTHGGIPTPAAEVVQKVVGSLLLRCECLGCGKAVQLHQLRDHVESGCQRTELNSPSKLTVGQILSRRLDAPPTSAEQRVATSVVKRLINTSPSSGHVSLPTAGQVSTHTLCTTHPFPYVHTITLGAAKYIYVPI